MSEKSIFKLSFLKKNISHKKTARKMSDRPQAAACGKSLIISQMLRDDDDGGKWEENF